MRADMQVPATPPAKPPLARALLRRYGPPLLIFAALSLILMKGWHQHLTLEAVVAQRDRFQQFLAAHVAVSVLAYVGLYSLLVALSLPCGFVMTTGGGLLFGWLGGTLAAIAGATLGAVFVFLIARRAVGDALNQRAGPWLAKLAEGFQKDALSYMLFLRLVPAFPFWFVNIAPAVLGVPLGTFVLGTVIGITPATFAFASAGAGLDSVILAAKNEHAACVAAKGVDACPLKLHVSSLLTWEFILALVLVGLVALMPIVVRRWKRRKIHGAAK